MAIRCKTVEYVFDHHPTSLATATRLDLTPITLTIPEVNARTFVSVEVDIMCVTNNTAGVSLTTRLIGISLGAVAVDDQTITQTLVNTTGSQAAYHFTRNVTTYFQNNFGSGSTQTCGVSLRHAGPATIDHTVKLIITYTYDDSAQDTRVKTVRIPLDSKTSGLTAVLAEIGTNQVPILDTTLPEASKVYKNIWFEILGASCAVSTTDSAMGFALDAAGETATGTAEHQPNTSNLSRMFFLQAAMDTSAVHAFKMRTTSTNYPFTCVSIVLCVTYTYSHSSSTRILNHVMMPMSSGTLKPGRAAAKPARYTTTLAIAEGGSLTLRQSGVLLYIGDNSLTDVNVRAGAQAFRQYSYAGMGSNDAAGTVTSHRIDAGAAQGAGITLAAGALTATFDVYSVGANLDWGANVAPILYLNYESDKNATYGDGAHNHTTLWASLDGYGVIPADQTVEWTPTPPSIPESGYFASSIALHQFLHSDGGNGAAFTTEMEIVSGESNAPSWITAQTSTGADLDFTSALIDYPIDVTAMFRKYPEAGTTPDIEATRLWRTFANGAPNGARVWVTYHAIAGTFAGVVTGYTGSGAGIVVDVYNATTKVWAGQATTTAGGSFAFSVYDGATYFAVAAPDSTHCGRSANAVGV